MDYVAWTDRARRFIARFEEQHPRLRTQDDIGPPATPDQVAEAEESIGRPLPRQFREFLLKASGDCSFGYQWEPENEAEAAEAASAYGFSKPILGGLEYFAWVKRLADDYQFHRELVEEGTYGDAPFCRDPLPIGGMINGDHIAIDLVGGSVVFLAHDSPRYVLAPDFDAFLRSWEAICYLNFNWGPYQRFVDKKGGGLVRAEGPETRRLRDLLFPGGWTD